MKKIILIVVIALLTGIGGAAAAFLLLGGEEAAEPGEAATTESAEPAEESRDPIYWSLDPKFTITYNVDGLRYLQVSMQVMSFEQGAIDSLKANMPAVRNSVIMLLSAQEFESLVDAEGKETLRGDVLETVQAAIRSDEELEDVFFTTFIMQ